jgi:hypothetical protein
MDYTNILLYSLIGLNIVTYYTANNPPNFIMEIVTGFFIGNVIVDVTKLLLQ